MGPALDGEKLGVRHPLYMSEGWVYLEPKVCSSADAPWHLRSHVASGAALVTHAGFQIETDWGIILADEILGG